ncbi:MAG: response regulator [Longimicrobiales bacterium]
MTEPQRLLVVEDDPEIQYLLTAMLSGADREVLSAASGAEASRHLDRGDVDLVILDLILPDVDGRTLLARMRDRTETAPVQVIVVTARGGPQARQDCYALGADAFVEKPFDPDELAADVAVRLGRAARARVAARSDSLTGLLNKAGLQAACADSRAGYTLAVIEVEDFGGHAERWGWDKAEGVVKRVAGALRDSVGSGAQLAHVGGGDFALLRTDVDPEAMAVVAAQALAAVKRVAAPEVDLDAGTLTATAGVATSDGSTSLDDVIDAARRRIFQARERTSGNVVTEDSADPVAGGRILVAEDDEISASILVHKLKKEGLDVVRFNNGQDAYKGALDQTPDLVILDVKMPGLDGFEVLDLLRKDTRFARTPIVMLTSMGQEADVVRGFALGADDYVLKPFSPVELAARVRRLLRRGRSAKTS